VALKETASQTAGPFLHIGMAPEAIGLAAGRNSRANLMAREGCEGERIRIEGVAYDGLGAPMKDALIEIWQADAKGYFHHPASPGTADPQVSNWGRCAAAFEDGFWWFETVKPGAVPAADGSPQAPHLNLLVFARGVNIHLVTRLYFADEEAANAADPVLQRIDSPARRTTLIAQRQTAKDGKGGQVVYRFDIRVQGDAETVFFDC